MDKNLIDILMPTYNGSKYIGVLLDSLFAQTFTDWHLYVRDDHSKDNTLAIITEYSNKYPSKITVLNDGLGNLGVNKNFSTLLATSKSPYACFCDQDDQWMPDKLEVSYKGMQKLERELPNKPCLVFSDLRMVDAQLNEIAPSIWKKEGLKPHYCTLNKLLVQTPINGCVMIMNRKLIDLAVPVPPEAMWFDHWVALIAASAGKLDYVNRTTINYRIHENNASRGDNRITKTIEESQLVRKLTNKNFDAYFDKLQQQAKAVRNRIESNDVENEKSRQLLDAFIGIRDKNAIKRRWLMVKNGFYKHSWATTIKWLLRI